MFTYRPAVVALASLACFSGLAFGQVDPAAREKLQQMADAFKQAQSLSFSVSMINTGVLSAFPEMKGTVTMARAPGGWNMRVEGSRGASMGSPEMTYVLTRAEGNATWIDHAAKSVVQRPVAQQSMAEPVTVSSLIIPQVFTSTEGFAPYLGAEKISAEEPTTADGQACDVIAVDLGQDKEKYRFAIAQSDHLPRKIAKTIAGGSDVMAWVLKGLRAGVPVSETLWKISTPEGYKLDAPPPPSTAPTTTAGGASTAPAGPKARAVGVNIDDLAPDFALKGPDGKEVRLADLRGQVVLLEFWGSWSPPCKTAGPEIQKIADKYKSDPVKVYGLAVREASDDSAAAFMRDNHLSYGLLLKADETAKAYRARVFPDFFVVGKEGQIVYTTANAAWGEQTPARLIEAIDAALAGRAMAAPTAPPTTIIKPGADAVQPGAKTPAPAKSVPAGDAPAKPAPPSPLGKPAPAGKPDRGAPATKSRPNDPSAK
jgi:peroxiredoxin